MYDPGWQVEGIGKLEEEENLPFRDRYARMTSIALACLVPLQ